MTEARPFASLSGALLARKGQALPAMRRQNMMALNNSVERNEALEDLGWNDMGHEDVAVPALTAGRAGLSPMGPSPIAAVPVEAFKVEQPVPLVVQQQRELVEEFDAVSEKSEADDFFAGEQADEAVDAVVAVTPVSPAPVAPIHTAPVSRNVTRAAPGSRGKAAFTLRLDAERHLKLRLVCALQHRSAQHVVTAALDAFLAKQNVPADLNSTSFNSAVAG